jgi:hypothetical protein
MNDRRMNELVRMAMEVEELEAGANRPQLRLVGAEPDEANEGATVRHALHGRWWAGAGMAAAAVLALYFTLPAMLSTPGSPAHQGPIVINPPDLPSMQGDHHDPTPVIVHRDIVRPDPAPQMLVRNDHVVNVAAAPTPVDPGSVEKCVVVAIYRDDAGRMHCVKSAPAVWSENRCLSEVSGQELRCASIGQACSSSADHALMVALAGPSRSLPKSDADAVGLATCILGSPCQNDSKCLSSAAMDCVPPDVSVKIETTAMLR